MQLAILGILALGGGLLFIYFNMNRRSGSEADKGQAAETEGDKGKIIYLFGAARGDGGGEGGQTGPDDGQGSGSNGGQGPGPDGGKGPGSGGGQSPGPSGGQGGTDGTGPGDGDGR
ncbi:MAG: hypothetical protein LBS32_08895 [Clostridiales Family XIII bacterium]|jgi:hypothetical protein|nr:hypothetical protein [Clostridiales Family XIII bacterium]